MSAHYVYLPGMHYLGMSGEEMVAWMISLTIFWLILAAIVMWAFARHPWWFARPTDKGAVIDQPTRANPKHKEDASGDDAGFDDLPDAEKKHLPLEVPSHTPPGVPPGLL